jgi:hypothetical protein
MSFDITVTAFAILRVFRARGVETNCLWTLILQSSEVQLFPQESPDLLVELVM